MRRQGYRFRLRPNKAQEASIRRYVGSCRWAWNETLRVQRTRREAGLKNLSYPELCKLLTHYRRTEPTEWLKGAPIGPLQQALRDQGRAFQNFFEGRAAPPRFRKKGSGESFRYPQPSQIKLDEGNSRIFLPKLGWIRYHKSRPIEGAIRNVTVSLDGQYVFMSIQTEREVAVPPRDGTPIGVDMGVASFATLSNGERIEGPNALEHQKNRLAQAQRRRKRMSKFGSNWKKQGRKIARIQRKIRDTRRDHLQKASTEISKNHAIIVMEDLKVSNMSRSAKGTADSPGTNVQAKSGLNRRILDQGWNAFRTMVAYKQEWSGGQLVLIDPRNTSRTCPSCGCVDGANRPTQAAFRCTRCAHEGHADEVAAQNILRAGHARIAREVNGAVRPSAAGTTPPARAA